MCMCRTVALRREQDRMAAEDGKAINEGKGQAAGLNAIAHI